jgi:hypothetical protein
MLDLNKVFLFRMTHIENIIHVQNNGITHVNSANANSNFVPIGDGSLIARRNNFELNNGVRLGDYIPFYLGVRTPMLYVIQKGFNMVAPTLAENIVYCVTSVQKIIDLNLDYVFTDGHAVDSFTTLYNNVNINDIEELLDWNAIKAVYWKSEDDLDKKRRKEAEFLVMGDIDFSAILGYVVYNQNAKERMIGFGIDESVIFVREGYYY